MAKDANGNEIPEAAPPATSPLFVDNFGIVGPKGASLSPWDPRPGVQPDPRFAPPKLNDNFNLFGGNPGANGPPAPAGDSGGNAEDPVFPGTPGQMGGHDDAMEALRAEMLMDQSLLGDNSKAPPKFYQPAHEEYSQLGGTRGKELFQRAFGDGPNDGPTKLQDAVRQSEEAQTAKNEAMAKFYDNEAARAQQAAAQRQAQMAKDAQETAQRHAKMEQATQYYTDDLHDQGKFWANPGNIVAAISFSLMPIFSSDPAVGVKLINQAIQQDLDHRRATAGLALGQLRSNLDGYMKITGDRQAGEQLAEAESRRVAALEVERIAAKFESPISKAKAEYVAQNLRQQAAKDYITAYSQAKVFSQAGVADPEVYKRRTSGYDGAWKALGVPDVAPIQPVAAAVNGSVGGSPSLASSQTGPNGGYTDHVAPEVRGMLRGGVPASVAAKLAMEGRVPGSANMFNMLSTYVNRMAAAEAKGVNYGPAFEAAKAKVITDAKKEIAAVPGLTTGTGSIAGRKATLADLIASADVIRASEGANGRNPDKFFGTMRTLVGDGLTTQYEQLARVFQTDGNLSPQEARARAMQKAKEDFHQKLSVQISSAYADISGGAISPQELEKLKQSIAFGSDFGFAYGWLLTKSKEVQDKEKQAVVGLSPIAKMVYMTRTGVGQRPAGLPVRAMAGPKRAPEGTGEYSAPRSTGGAGYSGYKSGG